MFMRFSDDLKSEWDRRLLPLWCCFLWICAAPFLSFYRVGPLSSFYLEAASLLGALMLVLVTAYKGLLSVRCLRRLSVCWFWRHFGGCRRG